MHESRITCMIKIAYGQDWTPERALLDLSFLAFNHAKYGAHCDLQEDWGELNTGKKVPRIFVLDIAKGQVSAINAPEDSSVGQPVWTPDGSGW